MDDTRRGFKSGVFAVGLPTGSNFKSTDTVSTKMIFLQAYAEQLSKGCLMSRAQRFNVFLKQFLHGLQVTSYRPYLSTISDMSAC